MMGKEWADLTLGERREERYRKWLEARGIEFAGEEAAQAYRGRLQRIIDAVRLREPDRVPCLLPAGQFPAYYAGITVKEAMYDYEAMKEAW